MRKTIYHRILATTALCLAAAGLSSCQQTKEVPYGEEMLPIDDGEMPILDYFSVISLQNRTWCNFWLRIREGYVLIRKDNNV